MSIQILPQPKQAEFHRTQKRSVLVIDDDEAMAEVLSRRLEQQGFAS